MNKSSADHPAAHFRAADASGVAVPSRMQLLEFLTARNKPATAAAIAAHFNLPHAAAAIGERLQRMQRTGLVRQYHNARYAHAPAVELVRGQVCGHADGYGFVPTAADAEDVFLNNREMRRVLHGDMAVVRVTARAANGRRQGQVMEVVPAPAREIVGRLRRRDGEIFMTPHDPRFAGDILIAADSRGDANDGDMVAVQITRHPIEKPPAKGRVVAVLGGRQTPGLAAEIAIRKHELPREWNAAVRAELQSMRGQLRAVQWKPRAAAEATRRDLRALPLVTIDGATARDFDDAVYCAPMKNGWQLKVAVADVSHYARPGGALDKEARRRGNSVYFPRQVVPMLPEELSTGICSLNPNVDRFCLTCDMRMDARGRVRSYEFYPAIMRSAARLTYDAVDDILNGDAKLNKKWRAITPQLKHLHELTRALLTARQTRGALDFEFPQADIHFDARQKISHVGYAARGISHRIIEECMLAANVCAAKFLQKHYGARAIYRNHHRPSAEALAELRQFLTGLGLQLDGGARPRAQDYARLLRTIADQPMAPVVQFALLRSMEQAVYAAEPRGHFALAYPSYTHFTSPIRRYSDLVVHRQIRRALRAAPAGATAADKSPDDKTARANEYKDLQNLAAHCSRTERRAEEAEREVIAQLKAEFMQTKIGQTFAGVISSVKEFGVFIQLNEFCVDGLAHVTTLGDDYFEFDAGRLRLVGRQRGVVYQVGDAVRVRVAGVNTDDGKIDFQLCAAGSARAPKPRAAKSAAAKSRHAQPKKSRAAGKTRATQPRKPRRK